MSGESENPKSKRRGASPRRIFGVLLGVVLSACGLIYVFSGVDLNVLLGTVERIRPVPLVGTIVVYWFLVVFLRALLVKHLLTPVGKLSVFRAYRCISIGFLANNVLPFRAGDVVRSAALSRGADISFASVIGSLALERILDMAMVALLALAAIQFAPLPPTVRTVALGMIGVLGVAFLVLGVLARKRWSEMKEISGGRLKVLVWRLWVRVASGFAAFGSARGIALAVILAAGLWGFAILSIMLRLEAFELPGTVPFAVVLLFSLGFGVALPSAPAYVGVYHAAAVFALELLGVEHSIAAAFGLFSWVIDVSLGCAIGGIGLAVEGFKLGDLRHEGTES